MEAESSTKKQHDACLPRGCVSLIIGCGASPPTEGAAHPRWTRAVRRRVAVCLTRVPNFDLRAVGVLAAWHTLTTARRHCLANVSTLDCFFSQVDIHEIEERKNLHINDLMKNHEKAFGQMKAYYNDITNDNLKVQIERRWSSIRKERGEGRSANTVGSEA